MTKSQTKNKTLSKEEVKAIKRRMTNLKKANANNASSTQAIIPYDTIFPDGTCHISGKKYSQTVEFYDTNYQLATFDEKGSKIGRAHV